MRIKRKEKKEIKKKKRLEQKKGGYIPWKVRSKKYSEYPYVVTVSVFRKTLFLSASDLRGRIKVWLNVGRLGYTGRNRTQYAALVAVAQQFFKKLPRYGIRDVFLRFSNIKRARHAIRKAIRKLKLAGQQRNSKYKSKHKPKPKPKPKTQWKWLRIKKKSKRVKIGTGQIFRMRNRRVRIKVKVKEQPKTPKRGSRKVRFLGIWTELHISFNGCRNKKKRRKRKRRRARKIRLI